MDVDEKTIAHLAELSNFALTEAQAESLKTDLGEIIKYISQLDELDTTGVEPTYQVFEMENIWRPDEITEQEADPEALLALTQNVTNHQIKVPKVL